MTNLPIIQTRSQKKLTPHSSVSIGGRALCNLRFADDTDFLGGRGIEKELQQLTERLGKTAADYDMKISSDESEIIANSIRSRPSTTG